MEKPVRRTLLPGVSDAGAPPPVVIDSRVVVARARRRAIVRDVIDLLLLVCVDGLFLRWNHAHVPFLDRHDSLLVLLALNAMLVGYVWLVRALPRWTARRVATTWCLAERTRFFPTATLLTRLVPRASSLSGSRTSAAARRRAGAKSSARGARPTR